MLSLTLWLAILSQGVLALKQTSASGILLKQTSLKTCNMSNVCLKIDGLRGFGSAVLPIYVFKDVEFIVFNDGKVIEKSRALSASVDFSLQEAILVQRIDGKITEKVFDLKTLDQKVFRVN